MLDNIDLDILKFMSERENYEGYNKVINKGLCTKESWLLVGDFGRYFEQYPDIDTIDEDFALWFRVTAHPGWKDEEHKIYGTIINNATTRQTPDRRVFIDQLARLKFGHLAQEQLELLERGDIDEVTMVEELSRRSSQARSSSAAPSFTLDDLAQHKRSDDGLYWRLEDLNQSIGPIRTGDFVVIGKRPEVGGTSFVCSEMSHMIEQLPEGSNAILFNNEEAPDKVFTRMLGAALNVDYRAMMNAPALHQQNYDKWLDNKEWTLEHDTSMDIASIHRALRGKTYGLIGINVLLKVGGTAAKEDHDKFQALGEEMRRIAQQHGPVLAVVQADPSAEGVRYIPQDRIYKSKTALQGEADVQIMIGSDDDNGPATARYIHVAKNKIPPAPCCDLTMKHVKTECAFNIGTGRFTSVNYTTNSRDTK